MSKYAEIYFMCQVWLYRIALCLLRFSAVMYAIIAIGDVISKRRGKRHSLKKSNRMMRIILLV